MNAINKIETAHRLELLADDLQAIADILIYGDEDLRVYAALLRDEANRAQTWASKIRTVKV